MILSDRVVFNPLVNAFLNEEVGSTLELPDDWGVLYLGCVHAKPPVVVNSWVLRVTKGYGSFAYVIRDTAYRAFMKIANSPDPTIFPIHGDKKMQLSAATSRRGVDHVMAELQKVVPTYALWPNMAWVAPSDNDQGPFDEFGRQRGFSSAVNTLCREWNPWWGKLEDESEVFQPTS
jgi:hypothetical protein